MHQYDIFKFEDTEIPVLVDNLFSSKKWIEVLSREYDFEFYYFVIRKEADVVIPFAVVNNLKGRQIISLPFSDYIATDNIHSDDYFIFIDSLKKKYPALPITLKTTFDDTLGIGKITRRGYYHTINLVDEVNYTPAFERGLTKAEKAGLVVVHRNTITGLRQFYSLYSNLRIRKFNSIPQPFSFFRRIFDVFISAGLGEIINVLSDGKIIASLIALKSGNTLYYKFGASDLDNLYSRPNNLLFNYLINYAKNINCTTLDLGFSGSSPSYAGLRRFKEGMGGIKNEITYYRFDPVNYDGKHENIVSGLLSRYTKSLIESNADYKNIERVSSMIYRNFA